LFKLLAEVRTVMRLRLYALASSIAAVILVVMFGVSAERIDASESCRSIRDPRWPGLEECIVTARTTSIVAAQRQKLSLWCWAAALSMIYGAQGHPISQEGIVKQNFGDLRNAPGGDFLTFEDRLNREYEDDRGDTFESTSEQIDTPEDARAALQTGIPILYTTSTHAMVQTSITYQKAPYGPVVFKRGILWDPANGRNRIMNAADVVSYTQAWLVRAR
jgi:hypothetical protein